MVKVNNFYLTFCIFQVGILTSSVNYHESFAIYHLFYYFLAVRVETGRFYVIVMRKKFLSSFKACLTIGTGSIPGRVKLKTIKIGIHSSSV